MTTSFPGTIPMAMIDGNKIRQLRESKGLTQLYLATVVGVTTDTISRWENRRYPSIKRDNAMKLAEALEVELEAILEEAPETPPEGAEEPTPSPEPLMPTGAPAAVMMPPATRSAVRKALWLLPVLAAILAATVAWWLSAGHRPANVIATRSIPAHTPPGQPFPVVITVSATDQSAFPLILKEALPASCRVLGGEPTITNINATTNEIQWIGRAANGMTTFAYMAKSDPDVPLRQRLTFAGTVTLKQKERDQATIGGNNVMTVDFFHWADTNRDNRIDDDEILTVYDKYGIIQGLDFDRDLIDAIWAGQGYRWDAVAGSFTIIP